MFPGYRFAPLLVLTVVCDLSGKKALSQSIQNCSNTTVSEPNKMIYIAFMTAFSGSFVSSGAIPAVDLAIERVNQNSSLLKGYVLNYTRIVDTKCDRVSSLGAFFDMLASVPPYPLAILGMGCAVATEPVAEINSNWRLPMMGYVAAAPSLSNRTRFKSYYRTYPSDAIFVPAVISFIRYFKWKKLLIITENANTFISNDRLLKNTLPQLGVNISLESFTFVIEESDEIIEQQISDIVTDRDSDDAHIFFINTFEIKARVILCKFYRLGVTSRNYVIITHGWYQNRWWSQEVANSPLNCSNSEMFDMLHGVIAVQQFPVAMNGSNPTTSGLSADEFDHLYRARLAAHPDLLYQLEATNAFDAVWALALALDNTSQSLRTGDVGDCRNSILTDNIDLEDYTFKNDRIECLINRSLNNIEFEGVSGFVQFDENGTRVQNVFLQQYRSKSDTNDVLLRVVFGIVHSHNNNNFNYINNESNSSVWLDDVPPDGVPIDLMYGVSKIITVIYVTFASVGIIFAVVCLFFNIIYRNKKVVKLTTPILNYFIVLGAVILYLSVIVHSLPGTSLILNIMRCYVANSLRIVGYTLAFSAVLAKICRVYYIFHNPSLDKKTVKDWQLLLACAVVAVSIILVAIENAVPIFRPHPTIVPDRERGSSVNARNVTVRNEVYTCGEQNISQKGIQIIALSYIIIIQVIGIALAFQTLKVKVKLLNDSKWIAAIIYSSSLCVVVIILSGFTLSGFLNTEVALLNGAVLVATTVFLTMLFIPKMIRLYKDPEGKNIFSSHSQMISQQHPSTVDRKVVGFMIPEDSSQHHNANNGICCNPQQHKLT